MRIRATPRGRGCARKSRPVHQQGPLLWRWSGREHPPFLTRRRRRRRRGPPGVGPPAPPPSLASSPLPVQRMALLFQLSLLFSGLTEVKEPGARPGQGGAPDLHLLQPRGSYGGSPPPRAAVVVRRSLGYRCQSAWRYSQTWSPLWICYLVQIS